MKYSIVEKLQDGRCYALVDDDDGARFGQIVDLRHSSTDAEQDAVVMTAVSNARAIRQAIDKMSANTREQIIGEERIVVEEEEVLTEPTIETVIP